MPSVKVSPITIPELHKISQTLGSQDVILDVRSPEEYAEGHIPNAKLIPVDEVEARALELQNTKKLFIYCRAGRRAVIAFRILQEKGLESLGLTEVGVVDEGGFPDWREAGFPVE